MKFKDQQDPFEAFQSLWGLRPAVQEQVNHTAHTQVEIPKRQAMLATQVRFASYLGVGVVILTALVGLAFIIAYFLGQVRYVAWGIGLLAFDIIAASLALAAYRPRNLLLQRMEKEIIDPYHDDTLREIVEAYIARMQPPLPDVQVKREPVPYKAYQNGQPVASPEEPKPEPPDEFDDLIAFAQQAAIRGLARESVWCKPNKPRIRLSTGTIVTQSKWRRFCELLRTWGLVENDIKGSYVWVDGINDDPQRAVDFLIQAKQKADDNDLWEPDEPIP